MKKLLLVLLLLFSTSLAFAGQLEILNVANESTIPSKIFPGDLVTLTFDVKNISGTGQGTTDISVSIELNENDFQIIKGTEFISELKSRATKTVSIRFKAKDNVLPGNYTIPIFLEYSSGNDPIIQLEEVDFDVSACNELIVGDLKLSDPQPHIGTQLIIEAPILNDCATSARDVTVELKSVTNSTIEPFVITSGTIKRFGNILPGESEIVKFSMLITDNVEAKTYVFSIDANCDLCGTTFSNKFSFQVLGKPNLVFSNIEYSVDTPSGSSTQIMPGSPIILSVQLDNIGEEKAKDVSVSLKFDDSITGSAKSFLGNIDPDDSGAAIFNLTISFDARPGEYSGLIIVSYIDELGVEQEFIEDYSLFVNEAPPTSPIVYIFILILLAVVLALVYFIVKFVFRQLTLRKHSR